MIGKIDENGYLSIERAKKFKRQDCPYCEGENYSLGCGDWCPLFGEPEDIKGTRYDGSPDGIVYLKLCQTLLTFTELTDERK